MRRFSPAQDYGDGRRHSAAEDAAGAGGGGHRRTKCCWSPWMASSSKRSYASGMCSL